MAEITLSNYIGFIFSEITNARDIADRHSRDIALLYAQDEIMKNFSVPRFKIPKMDLTIPVLISGAKFSNVFSFVMQEGDFKTFINSKAENAVSTIKIKESGINNDFTVVVKPFVTHPIFINPIITKPFIDRPFKPMLTKAKGKQILKGANKLETIDEFYALLKNNADIAEPENIIQVKWSEVFNQKITENNLLEVYKKHYPTNELFTQSLKEVSEKIKASIIITQSKMENLLVNPETNMVKTGSSESTVFTIAAQITEEGIFIRSVKEAGEDKVTHIVEFE